MAVSIQWANKEKSGLILTFDVPWSWDEYEILSDSIQDMFASVDHDLDLILDLQNVGEIPDAVMSHMRDAYADIMLNLRQYIYVGLPSDFVDKLDAADRYFTALGGELQYKCVDSLQEAQRISLWDHLVAQYEANLAV